LAELADAVDSKSTARIQNTLENQANSQIGNPNLRKPCSNYVPDADLGIVVRAWPDLPAEIRKSITILIADALKASPIVTAADGRPLFDDRDFNAAEEAIPYEDASGAIEIGSPVIGGNS
jgi:hypothetical protein